MNNERQKTKNEKKVLPWIFVFFLLSAYCIVFSTLCLFGIRNQFFTRHAWLFSLLAGALFLIVYGICVRFVIAEKEILTKSFLGIYVFLAFCLTLMFILQRTGFFRVIKDAESLQNYLQNSGRWMPTVYIVLQYLQVVILPIPGIVSTVAGVALFGAFHATLYSLIGILLGSFTAFIIGRKLGGKAVAWMVGKENLAKWQKKLKGKDNLFLTLMFFLPLFPDDILCFLAGLSTMSLGYFVSVVFFARMIGIVATCFSFDFIPFNTWWGLMIWGILILTIAIVFVVVYKNMDKLQKKFSKYLKRKSKGNKS